MVRAKELLASGEARSISAATRAVEPVSYTHLDVYKRQVLILGADERILQVGRDLLQSSMVVATDPDTGAQVEYATLRSSNSHRVWADLEQIPTNLQYAFICTEDKDCLLYTS